MKNYIRVGKEIIRLHGVNYVEKAQGYGYYAQCVTIHYSDNSNVDCCYHTKSERNAVFDAILEELNR